MSATANSLNGFVNYKARHPREYSEKKENGFNGFRDALRNHLAGPRGISLINLYFKEGRDNFDASQVGLGHTPACPTSLRELIIAQHTFKVHSHCLIQRKELPNLDSIRITNIFMATFGMALSLIYRVIRVVIRTLLAPLTLLYARYQGTTYGLDRWVQEDFKRITWEWVDLALVLYSCFAGIVNTFKPDAINLDSLRDYYIARIDEAIDTNRRFATAKKDYLEGLELIAANDVGN